MKANELSGAEEVTTSTANRGRKEEKKKKNEETIVEIYEALAEVENATPKETPKKEPRARSRTRSAPEEKDTSEANVFHIDDIDGNRNPSTSTEDKPKKTRRIKHNMLEDVHKAIRDREDPYCVGHRRGAPVGAGRASKSKNKLPHDDADPRYANVLW